MLRGIKVCNCTDVIVLSMAWQTLYDVIILPMLLSKRSVHSGVLLGEIQGHGSFTKYDGNKKCNKSLFRDKKVDQLRNK